MSATLAERHITEKSHRQFAELSGDLNPLHVDAEAAETMPPGQRLAYGMDMLLWALEALAPQGALPVDLARVRARFTKWVFLGDTLELRRAAIPSGNTYEVFVGDATVAVFDLYAGELLPAAPLDCTRAPVARRTEPRRLLLHELEGQEALVPVADKTLAATMFPRLATRFGAQWLSECATCSYIIGMEAPGLYSMSMKYDLRFCALPADAACMHYKVIAADERFRKVRIAVNGTAISALLEAMVREP